MFNRENYDISPEDSEKSARIRRHTADLAIIDFEAGTPFFWDNEGIAFKRMVSIKTGYYYQHNTIPMIYAAREHGYTDCRWGGILALKGAHLYKQDEGVELEVWANEVSVKKTDDNGNPVRIDTIVVSTQHDDFIQPADDSEAAQLKADEEMLGIIRNDVVNILMPRVIASIHHEKVLSLFNDNIKYHVNPTGKFVIGGPHGDTGLTGRKIIVDTYGGKGAHGGGAFSGKDPSKVDRSAAYAARHIAKNLVAAGVADEMLVQVSYAIGVARPINIYVNTYGRSHVNMSDGEIARKIDELFDLRPKAIEDRLKLRNPIYQETAAYGHMGREPQVVTKHFKSRYEGDKDVTVELFTWEKLDYVDKVKAAFGL